MGGGGLWDIGCYRLSFYPGDSRRPNPWRYLAGRLLVRPGSMTRSLLRYASRATFLLTSDCSIRVPFRVFMEIAGDEADPENPPAFQSARAGDPGADPPGKDRHCQREGTVPYLSEVEDMADAILMGRPR